jgi:DNA-binding transcriptional MerR regulator
VNITELAEAVGETPRQVRYLIAEGFIPAPAGSRARPNYGPDHETAIRRYQRLRQDYKPTQIKALLEADRLARDGWQTVLAPGVVLSVSPALLDPGTQPRAIGDLAAAAFAAILQRLAKETSDAA